MFPILSNQDRSRQTAFWLLAPDENLLWPGDGQHRSHTTALSTTLRVFGAPHSLSVSLNGTTPSGRDSLPRHTSGTVAVILRDVLSVAASGARRSPPCARPAGPKSRWGRSPSRSLFGLLDPA